MPQYDVAVVGAGPVGLSLAVGLARDGRSAIVLEKEPGTSEHSRAPLIWPRTQEILAGLGLIERFRREALPISEARVWDADRDEAMLEVSLEELAGDTPFPRLLLCPQSRTEKLLADAVEAEDSVELVFGAEARDLTPDGDSVEVRYRKDGRARTVRAAYAVGCDGGGSTVRDVLGATFDGHTYGVEAALADVRLEKEGRWPFPRMTRNRSVATALRIDSEVWRLMMPYRSRPERPLEERIGDAVTDLFSTTSFETVWKSEFHLHRRLSSCLARGRIALAGDAAHLNSPVGGRGMNVGIQDAHALREALSEALRSGDPERLSTYASERRSAVEGGMFRALDWLTRGLMVGGGGVLFGALRLADLVLRLAPLRRAVLRRLAMLDDPSRSA